jgi:hypothetical protein
LSLKKFLGDLNLHHLSSTMLWRINGRKQSSLFYPTFPKMGADYFPDGIFKLNPWPLNFVENVALIQVIPSWQ